MAPSKDTKISNDTASVPALAKTVQATNGSNGVNGNGVAALKASNAAKDLITGQTVLNGKSVSSKTQIKVQTEVRSFDCVKHVRPAQFPEALGPLPFPGELRGMVAWTNAFVERLGWMALLEEQNVAKEKLSNSRVGKEKEKLLLEIQGLKTKVHDLVDDNHDLKGQNAQLKSRNRFLEGHNKRDDQQIENFKACISEKQTEIWILKKENENLKKENSKLKASAISREELFKELIEKYVGEQLELLAEFEEHKKTDQEEGEKHKEEDKKREAFVTELQTKLKDEEAAKDKAQADLKTKTSRVADLEAENALLDTKQKQLDGALKDTREQLQKADKDLGVSEGEKATLKQQLQELTAKEKSAQVEIQSLHGQLDEAKDDVEAAKRKVLDANEHAKSHWHTIQTIRADLGWFSKEERDACDANDLVTKFDCEFQAGPGYKDPKPLVFKPTCTLEVDPKVEKVADIENPFN